ncbi:hypothetical protein [Asticcacaulis sp. MM231]|uniref:hypothetical protein n=1 Tax=Asticcacaulis sp. MM231 TaxID=3157666 RepID=UPI0032D5A4D2
MAIDGATVLVSILSSIVAGIAVAWTNHLLTLRLEKKRDSKKRIDDLNVQRRINAWKTLERAATIGTTQYDPDTIAKLKSDFDQAFAEIMLLGIFREVELADRYAEMASNGGEHEGITNLLNDLRDTLRAELNLQKVPPMNKYFRLLRIAKIK